MATGDPILVGNANRGDVGFGDATILSAEPRSALDCVLYVEPIGKRAGNGIVTRTAKAMLPVPPTGRFPTRNVQVVPAAEPSGQLHPVSLLAASKVVNAGTVSLMATVVASWVPTVP